MESFAMPWTDDDCHQKDRDHLNFKYCLLTVGGTAHDE